MCVSFPRVAASSRVCDSVTWQQHTPQTLTCLQRRQLSLFHSEYNDYCLHPKLHLRVCFQKSQWCDGGLPIQRRRRFDLQKHLQLDLKYSKLFKTKKPSKFWQLMVFSLKKASTKWLIKQSFLSRDTSLCKASQVHITLFFWVTDISRIISPKWF